MDHEQRFAVIEARLTILESARASAPTASIGRSTPTVGEVANDRELDSTFGNPEIRKDPTAKYWSGKSYVGKKYSMCPPDYLNALAEYLTACAFMTEKENNPDKLKYAGYNRKDAARARGWALRNAGKPLKSRPAADVFEDQPSAHAGSDEIPF